MKLVLIFICGLILGFYLNNNCNLNHIILKLTRQAARWSTAASQDENNMIAVLHANYGAGYLWAIKDIASDQQFKNATGLDPKLFETEIVKIQDQATKKMAKLCPKYAPKPTYLTSIGGEGI